MRVKMSGAFVYIIAGNWAHKLSKVIIQRKRVFLFKSGNENSTFCDWMSVVWRMWMNSLIPLSTLCLQSAHLVCSCHRIRTLLIGCEAFRSWNWKWDFFFSFSLHGVSIKCHAQNVFALDIRPSLYQTKCDIVALWPWLRVCSLEQQQQQRYIALIKCAESTGRCTSSVRLTNWCFRLRLYFNFRHESITFGPPECGSFRWLFRWQEAFSICAFSHLTLCLCVYLSIYFNDSLSRSVASHANTHIDCIICFTLFTNYTSKYSTVTWNCPMHLNCAYYHYSTSINYTKNN